MNFNSRPSARGDDCQRIQPFLHFISIHAPPRGATVFQFRNVKRICISIHAPPRGATGASAPRRCLRRYFNSRPSARGDWFGRNYFRWNRISIHAPPRGATQANRAMVIFQLFQFTPLREGRPIPGRNSAAPIIFQFTPLREGRLKPVLLFDKLIQFQFTPLREGRRGRKSKNEKV